MIEIRPVSDLRNHFSDIEELVQKHIPVYLTKNGYGTMVVMSLDDYSALMDEIELKLTAAERMAEQDPTRLTADQVFGAVRGRRYEKV